MANVKDFTAGANERNIPELFLEGEHISIQDLKTRKDIKQKKHAYLYKELPDYPKPVEFHTTEVSHVTIKTNIQQIWNSGGFKGRDSNSLSWWSLKINEADLGAAEKRYLNSKELVAAQQPFLSKFTKSPAFDNDTSRYGNFRFTFPLTELMEAYKQQKCESHEPVLRVYGTKLFKQKIEYIILVHSPEFNAKFSHFPLLTSSLWVAYDGNKIIWKAQAICETHNFKMVINGNTAEAKPLDSHVWYVWDQVSLVFHINGVLTFPKRRLKEIYTYCKLPEEQKLNLSKDINHSCEEADYFIKSLPDE